MRSTRWFKRRWRAGTLACGGSLKSLRWTAREYANASRRRDDIADLRDAAAAWLHRKGSTTRLPWDRHTT